MCGRLLSVLETNEYLKLEPVPQNDVGYSVVLIGAGLGSRRWDLLIPLRAFSLFRIKVSSTNPRHYLQVKCSGFAQGFCCTQ